MDGNNQGQSSSPRVAHYSIAEQVTARPLSLLSHTRPKADDLPESDMALATASPDASQYQDYATTDQTGVTYTTITASNDTTTVTGPAPSMSTPPDDMHGTRSTSHT